MTACPSPILYHHVALVVPDLQEGMDQLGAALGLTWASVQKHNLHVWTPDGPIRAPLECTYSQQGPPYWELFQQQPTGIYTELGHHHYGLFADGQQAQVDKLAEIGYFQEFAGTDADGNLRGFRYLKDSSGNRIEVLERAESEPMLKRWIAGGDYYGDR